MHVGWGASRTYHNRVTTEACASPLKTAKKSYLTQYLTRLSPITTSDNRGMRIAVLVLSFSGALSQCASYYNNVMSACDLANPGNEATRFCNGACNAALNTASNGCSASVTEEAQGKQNTDQMLSYCSGSSASGSGRLQVDVTSDKGAGTPSGEFFIGICAFATSGSAPVFCH